jgi:hypothetical protein
MNLKKILLIGLIIFALAAAYVWFFIYNKPHKDIEASKADYKTTIAELVKEFETNHDTAWVKYRNKVVEISAEVDSIVPNDSITSVVFNVGGKYEVYCEMHPDHNTQAKQLAKKQKVVLKGLVVHAGKYDPDFELAGDIRLKKGSIGKE